MNDGDANCLATNGKEITLNLRQANNKKSDRLKKRQKKIHDC